MLELDFMRDAFLAGGCIAIAAGLVGYFVVLRNQVFTADALGHGAFTGTLGGVLAGFNVLAGALASCVAIALAIGTLGGRGRGRDVAVGTVFAWLLGIGVLFLSIYTGSRSAAGGGLGVAVLFGSILSLQPGQVVGSVVASLVIAVALLVSARPLLFLSVDPDVAIARGVPARAITALFLVLVAATVAVAVQAVGALLIFALLVTPAAAAQNITSRPWLGLVTSASIALAAVWSGLVVSFYVSWPASFLITALAFAAYLVSFLRRRAATLLLAALMLLPACAAQNTASSGKLEVVAAESFWGSLAAQVGGDHVRVTSIIVNPAADPHDYDPTPGDARRFAEAGYVIVNGAGYDAWASKLLAANPVAGRKVLDVAAFAGVREGQNPHLWYAPAIVERVVAKIGADLGRSSQATDLWNTGFAGYRAAIATIKAKYAGTKVGATESIVAYTAAATALDVITPATYLQAISEGADPSAQDKATVLDQVATRKIRVLVFNAQNSTPEVQSVVERARAAGVPVVSITETLSPAGITFQAWQTAQLESLLRALGS